MPFCGTCGSPVEGRFCAKCGSAVGAAPAPGNPRPSGPAQPMAISAPMADNVASTLCYAVGFITGILFLVIAPYNQNRTVRFHAFQSIFMSVACMVIGWGLRFILLALMPGGFTALALFGLVVTVINLAFIGLWIFMLVSTYQGKTVVLPVIGPLAQSQAGA